MHKNFILFNFAAFLLHSCYATTRHFWFHITSECIFIKVRLNCFIQIMGCLSIPSAFIWSYLADRMKWHRQIIAINILLYILASVINFKLKDIGGKYIVQCGCVLATLLREIAIGGTFSIFFALVLNYTKRTNSSNRNVGIVKMSGIFGIIFVMMVLGIAGCFFPALKEGKRNIALAMCVLSGVLSALVVFFSLPEFIKPETVLFKKKISVKDFFRKIYQYTNPIILTFFITTVLIGLNRMALDNFSASFCRLIGYEMHHIRLFFGFRMILEAIILFYSESVCKLIGVYHLLLLAAVCTVFRTFIHTVVDLLQASKYRKASFICAVEAFKAISTSAYFYSSTLIFRSFAKYDTQTLALGLNNCAYNGIPSVLFSIISLIISNPLSSGSSSGSNTTVLDERAQYKYFLTFFQIVTIASFFGVIITAVGIYLVKRNRLENFEWTMHK